MNLPSVLESLEETVGEAHVLRGDMLSSYNSDWTGRWQGAALTVVRPGNVRELSTVMSIASTSRTSVVPRGGGTGLVGGAVPTGDGTQIVIDMTRFTDISLDHVAGTARVGAGVTLTELNAAASEFGLRFAVDLGSRDSCTIGGMISTNAGGLRMMSSGDTASQVMGVTMVTGDGTVVERMRGLAKDNVGVRWFQLAAGAEGTLGVVASAVVKLVPLPRDVAYGWFPVTDPAWAMLVASKARLHAAVTAIEYVHRDGLTLVSDLVGRTPPSSYDAVIIETASADPMNALIQIALELGADDALLADGTQGADLWAWRDCHTEAIALAGTPAKCDVAVPLSRWAEFHDAVPAALAAVRSDLRAVRFGHIADGNLHVNVLTGSGAPPPAEADDAVWRCAAEHGGTISAEHGIGVAKAPWLHLVRDEAEHRLIESLRSSFDPADICAPQIARSPERPRL